MQVAKILCYPVKSCRGVELDECLVTPSGVGIRSGLSVDRVFCVIDNEGFVQDIRIRPELATIEVNLHGCDGSAPCVELSATVGMRETKLKLPLPVYKYADADQVCVSDRHRDKWFGKPLAARHCGSAAARWITAFIRHHGKTEESFSLARFDNTVASRRIKDMFKGKSSIARLARETDTACFADCAPFHLLSAESLADLGRRIPAASDLESPLSFRRFRPNFLISGGAPYSEDQLSLFSIGAASFQVLGATARCVIPNTSPETGCRSVSEDPRRTLMTYRPLPYGDGPHGGPSLGVWCAPRGELGLVVRRGDKLSIITQEKVLGDGRSKL